MISPDQYSKFRLCTLSITGLLSLLLLISPLSLFSQDSSPPSPDFDGNGTVDIPDFLIFVDLFGSKEGEEGYDAQYDLDGDGEIGIGDFLIFVDSFGQAVNSVPIFTSEPPVTRSVDENTPSGQPIGEPISATDGDGDILTYRLSGADANSFAIDASTGQISTQGTYDFEQKSSYSVTVIVSDGEGGEASLVVNITINNIEEPSATVPSNVVVEEGDSKLTVRWDAVPDEEGKPPITGYEVGYGERPDASDSPSDEWAGIQKVSSQLNSLIITGLLNGQAYLVSVRTLVDGGMSEWSSPVLGIPVIPAVGPVFIGGGGGGGSTSPPPSPPPPPPPQQPVNPPVVINDNDPPQVTISAGTTPVTEGTSATFTITASPAPTSALTVNVTVTQTGDVISGAPSSSVTINANNTSATLTVATDDDNADETNGVVTAEVETGTGYTVGSTSSASVTVEDNDDSPPVDNSPDLVIYAMVVSHGLDVILDEPFSFRLDAGVQNKGNGPSAATTLRYYRSTDATFSNDDTQVGTDDVDGLAASGTSTEVIDLTTQPSAGTYYIACVDAVSGESNTDNNCSSIQVGTAPPPPPPPTPQVTISAGTTPVTEGTSATFTITASPAPTSALTVNVTVTQTGDVISGAPSSSVTINANNTSATLTVATDDDDADETNGVVTARLQGGTDYTVGSSSSASVTVEDNDNPAPPPPPPTPQVTISAGTTPVTEGTSATFTITASPAPTSALTVNVTVTQTGDVISGSPSSSVTINANNTSATLTVATDDDDADETNGVVTARLQGGTDYTVGSSSSASVTVEDNDNPAPPPPPTPQVTISAGTSPVTEGTSATFTITASPAPTSALTVNVTVTQTGDVISGSPSSSVTINANNTSATLTVATDNDQADETNGVVTAEVQSGTGYTVGSSSSASVTVNDNDDSPPSDNSPDLTFIALVVTRSPFIEDLSVPFAFKLSATVENEGNGPSAATTLRYYRSTDATYSTDDTQVGTDDVDGLAASGTSREEINLTTQPSDGTYYIACIDAVAGESNTENNCHSIQVGTAPSN